MPFHLNSPSVGALSAPSVYSETYTPANPRYSSFFASAPAQRETRVEDEKSMGREARWSRRLDMAQLDPDAPTLTSPTSTPSLTDARASTRSGGRPSSRVSRLGPLTEHPVLAHSQTGDLPVHDLPNSARESARRRQRRREAQRPTRRTRLGCVALADPAMRLKLLYCAVSASILVTTLIIFFAMSGSTRVFSQDVRIVSILLILFFTVVFGHSLVRLGMLLQKAKKRKHPRKRAPSPTGDVAVPSEPIRVVLARDEEMGLTEDVAQLAEKMPPPPPPVYGVWRGSVKADPNLLHWQRVERQRPLSEAESIHQPPGYVHDDVSDYGVPAAQSPATQSTVAQSTVTQSIVTQSTVAQPIAPPNHF